MRETRIYFGRLIRSFDA